MDQKSRPTSILKVTIQLTNPANTKHLYRPNICTTPAQRLRRWANTTNVRLYKRFVFAGNTLSPKRADCLENVGSII